MSYLFQSSRLGFRPLIDSDLLPMAAINSDPAVMEFFPKRQSTTETQAFIDIVQQHHAAHGYAWYAVDILENKEFIGFIGLIQTPFEASFTPCTEIGWRLKKAAWGKGYATEGATRCLAHGFQTLQLPEIYSFTATVNHRSERVMQKIGMTKVGEFDHPKLEKGNWLERHVLYRIVKEKGNYSEQRVEKRE